MKTPGEQGARDEHEGGHTGGPAAVGEQPVAQADTPENEAEHAAYHGKEGERSGRLRGVSSRDGEDGQGAECCREASWHISSLTAHPCRAEGGHLVIDLHRCLDEDHGQSRSCSLAETHVQVQHGVDPQTVEERPVPGLRRAVTEEEVVCYLLVEKHGNECPGGRD